MTSGIRGMDHNDVALGFYVLCSLWAYVEYRRSPKWYWIFLVGFFAGCAILNKWLIGLFVFLCWGISVLLRLKKFPFTEAGHYLLALLVCCCVFVPWQLYILNHWPAEANYVYDHNRRHITEALDGHAGSIWYYLEHFPTIINGLWPFVFIGIFFGFRKTYRNNITIYSLLAGFLFVFCFFSFIVKTKVPTHFFFVAPIFFLYMSIGIIGSLWFIKNKYLLIIYSY